MCVWLCKEWLGLLVDPENPDRRLETWVFLQFLLYHISVWCNGCARERRHC
jgi:hypothetical protein